MGKFCKVCAVYMSEHPELLWWRKCQTCGYSEMVLEQIHPNNLASALKNPYAKRFPSQAEVSTQQADKK